MVSFNEAKKLAEEIKDFAKSIIKPGEDLLEITEKIEDKIKQLGCKPAFPINLCKDEIAAHHQGEKGEKASGLLKVDIGIIHHDYIIDFAFSLDLTEDKKYTKLIQASEKALQEASKLIKKGAKLGKIGKTIQTETTKAGFVPIRNLSGHQIERWNLHSGLTIPNYDNEDEEKLEKGVFAVEPFATSGAGLVIDGKPSGIYQFKQRKAIRDSLAREIMDFIEEEYKELPFCERWIKEKFPRASFSLKLMEQAGILHNYATLIEKNKQPVSQAEDTFLIE